MTNNKTGIELIAEERQRQIEKGFTIERDLHNGKEEMAFAAIAYAIPGNFESIEREYYWPWSKEWWKPTPHNRVRELAKAGALIAAEIDRLQNLKALNHD